MQDAGLSSPPRARLTFRVGVVGHRLNRLPADPGALDRLRTVIRGVLSATRQAVLEIKDEDSKKTVAQRLYSDAPALLRAISPLAEGTDRIFADEASKLAFELCCPLPFHRDEFLKDFVTPSAPHEPNSVANFERLLALAERQGAGAFELDGDRSDGLSAYGAAGRVVLNQSDMLVVVWDGDKPAGGGGTVQTLEEALRYGVPVLWISPHHPHQWQRIQGEADLSCLQGALPCVPVTPTEPIEHIVAEIVNAELALPRSETREGELKSHITVTDYFAERRPWLNLAFVWKFFRDLVGSGKFAIQEISVRDFVEKIRADWPAAGDPKGGPASSASSASLPSAADYVNSKLRAHYAWSDKLADLYADAYRSAYVLSYLLSALAVFVALLPMAMGWQGNHEMKTYEMISVATEFVILGVIVVLLHWGSARHWHERWMEYRLLAELIRQIRLLIPLGGGRPLPHVPAHLTSWGDPTQTWMFWHMRAIARETGIPRGKVTPEYVRGCLDYLDGIVGDQDRGQQRFHLETKDRSERIRHRLHRTTVFLFALTMAGIGLHLIFGSVGDAALAGQLDRWLVLSSATLPALGAALAGINNQGEFIRLAKRSEAMAGGFSRFKAEIEQLRAKPVRLVDVVPLASEIADVMVQEVVDWRVMFFDRRPTTV